MDFMIAAHSDVGIKKSTNQDSLMVKVAQTGRDKACLCVLCDGMGGLAKGELASATVIREFESWFEVKFPELLKFGLETDKLKAQWNEIVQTQNRRLAGYAARNGCRMGTTVVACLLFMGRYYIMNVGDSRAYAILDSVYQLTKDQSLVQYQVDQGMIAPEDAERHPQRNVLLQCVGASEEVTPDFYEGHVVPDSLFMLCSDGFRHEITEHEIYEKLNPAEMINEQIMKDRIVWLTELDKYRQEADNISVVTIKVCQEGEKCCR
ncbi:MAG: serine/threonine-protein phosphatase [Clostridiales bacterium]|nr:serine/threonine-protein phosphatase [Clostridiales bacterium]